MSKVQEIVEQLVGTCRSFNLDDTDLTVDELKEVDGLIFCCEGCSWWCEISEDHEGLCDDYFMNLDEEDE